jgi:hypothetical protein
MSLFIQSILFAIFAFRFFGSMLADMLRDETPIMVLEPLYLIWLGQLYIGGIEVMVIRHMQRKRPWKIPYSVGVKSMFMYCFVCCVRCPGQYTLQANTMVDVSNCLNMDSD